MIALAIIGGLIGGLVILLNPFVGLLGTEILVPLALLPAVGAGFLGIFTAATPIKIVGGVTFLGAFLQQLMSGKKWTFLKEPTVRFYNLFFIYIIINAFAMPSSFSRENLTFYFSIAILGIIILTQINTLKRARIFLWVYFICNFIISLQAIMNYNTIKHIDTTLRSSGTSYDPNYFAISLLPFIAISFYNSHYEKNTFLKVLSLGMSFSYLAALAVTQSRGGFVGLVVMIFIAFIFSKKKFNALIIILIASALIATLMPASFWDRFQDTKLEVSEGEEMNAAIGSTQRRYYLALAAWEIFLDHPVFGVGIGNYYYMCADYEPIWAGRAHTMLLEIMAELGAVGTFLFLGMVFSFFKCLQRMSKAPPPYNVYAQAMFVGHIGFLMAAFFLHAQQEKGFWMIMYLAVAMERIWRKEQSPEPAVQGRKKIEKEKIQVDSPPNRTKWGKRKLGY